jgi:hypothetical protein
MFFSRVALASIIVVALASCFETQVRVDAPDAMDQGHRDWHRVQIRMKVAFQSVGHWRPEFGDALKAKLAYLAKVPEKTLHLIDFQPGSMIAEFLVMPGKFDSQFLSARFSAEQIVERLGGAVTKNGADLCALPGAIMTLYREASVKDLTGASLEGCTVEIKDLSFAASVHDENASTSNPVIV